MSEPLPLTPGDAPRVAVIAHRKKSMGGGLAELRRVLAGHAVDVVDWHEISRSREAPDRARQAIDAGATLLFVWGGDGTIQRCLGETAGRDVALAILPAGTANLMAANLGIPNDVRKAVRIGLSGTRRRLDVGVLNGKQFGVMAGVGFDAHMMQIADARLKDRFGRLAYFWAAFRATRMSPLRAEIEVDGSSWFTGRAAGILLGQMGGLTGGLVAFPYAAPDDGLLEIAVIKAESPAQWIRVLGRLLLGQAERSSQTQTTRGRSVVITLDHPAPYQLDGGTRKPKKRFIASVDPGAITVCVPRAATDPSGRFPR
jgi:diacylglycerol kinase family enzyme